MWDFNYDKLIYYDVLPYFRNCYKDRIKKSKEHKGINESDFNKYFKVPETLDEFKKFVENESKYRFWSRCEYEMICHGWPVQKNDYEEKYGQDSCNEWVEEFERLMPSGPSTSLLKFYTTKLKETSEVTIRRSYCRQPQVDN